LTGAVYWFIVNANYFPKYLTLLVDKPEILTNKINNNINDALRKVHYTLKFRDEEFKKYAKNHDLDE